MEVRELLGLEPVSLFTKRSRLWWLGHVEYKDESHWVKRCMLMWADSSEGTSKEDLVGLC